ncbi:MAG: hypothetical protein IMW98_06610 [Firmicutes bacterium]|nr:hypothetical protein [Bacillota bacterium]
MNALHEFLAIAIVAGYFAAMLWGVGAWLLRRPRVAVAFWWYLRSVAALLAVQGAFGAALYASGLRPPTPLHLMYGLILFAGAGLAESLRPGGRLRRSYAAADRPLHDARTAAFLGFALWAVALRAAMTGLWGF